MKKQQLSSFYLEALLLLMAFVAMILVLTGVFGVSRTRSAEAGRLSRAVTLAANAAEAVSAADSLEQAAELLDEGGNVRLENGKLTARYRSDGSPCAEGEGELCLSLSWESAGGDEALVKSLIEVCAAGEETPVYTLETARYRKGAAA